MRYVSADRQWRVTPIAFINDKGKREERIRVEHTSARVHGRTVMHAGPGRMGPVRTGRNWWLIADVRSVNDVARYVPLDQLGEDE